MPFDMIPREDQVLTPELAFTIAVEHLKRQGLASRCDYECEDGTMCAVGALMTQDERFAMRDYPVAILVERGLFPERLEESYQVLYDLQRFHDNAVYTRNFLDAYGNRSNAAAYRQAAEAALASLRRQGMPEDGIATLRSLIP